MKGQQYLVQSGENLYLTSSVVSVPQLLKFIAKNSLDNLIDVTTKENAKSGQIRLIFTSMKKISKEEYDKTAAKNQIEQFKSYKRYSKDNPNTPAPKGYDEWLEEETKKQIAKLETALKNKKSTNS
jgi:hypothetical protein